MNMFMTRAAQNALGHLVLNDLFPLTASSATAEFYSKYPHEITSHESLYGRPLFRWQF
jgi:hypothetical protein